MQHITATDKNLHFSTSYELTNVFVTIRREATRKRKTSTTTATTSPPPPPPSPLPIIAVENTTPVIPPAQKDEPSAAPGELLCQLCEDRSTKIMWECGHIYGCITCSREWFTRPENQKHRCPCCNKPCNSLKVCYITNAAGVEKPVEKKPKKKKVVLIDKTQQQHQ